MRQPIVPGQLRVNIHDLWEKQWLLLCAGDATDFNMMTIAWGSTGCMWGKPFVQVVVRPQRHTWQFMEKYDTFTVSAFPPQFRADLQTLGTLSGRDGDKLAKTTLHAEPSTVVACPSFTEADLSIECRKLYAQNVDPACFLDPTIERCYPTHDYHRIYFGEIVALTGSERYL